MPARTQTKIRRDINRLKETVERHVAAQPSLAAIKVRVDSAAALVNQRWQEYQESAVSGDKERKEREDAVTDVQKWVQRWRPVVLLSVPGADANLSNLPSSGATPDDVVRVAQDMKNFLQNNPGAADFKEAALSDLGDMVEKAMNEISDSSEALAREAAAREAWAEASMTANTVLVRGSEVVRAIFGPKSPEYKQFISRDSSEEEEADTKDAGTGEG